MRYEEVEEMEKKVMALVVKRRSLGGFDVNAGDILVMSEMMLDLIQHTKSLMRKPKNTPLSGS